MVELPTGTVTFLFTDIEGSTKLLHELGDSYADALIEHRRALREAVAAHAGVEVDTQGDAFLIAFARASDALAAASMAQDALASGPVRVRMGIHTGEPLLTQEGYVGLDVHRGARVMAAGHGRQVLISQTTYDLLDERFEIADLGEHRLKDLSAPQHIFQLGAEEFPPLATLHQTNLPIQPTPLVGREAELAEAASLLDQNRVVTFVGPGGSGKTRLALQLAAEKVEDFRHGVFWVPLQAVDDPKQVLPAISQAVGVKDGPGEFLGGRQTLLVLDNLEHVLEAAPGLTGLLRQTTDVKLLVTSREPLRIAGEHRFPVEPLPETDAITLFVERACEIDPHYELSPAIAGICQRLDGLPLALELAAARVSLLSAEDLLDRLERALPILTGGARDAPARQRTLHATIDWSYELLDEAEQRLFRSLSVFAGSFDLDSAIAVCEADLNTLQSLVDKSLVRRWESGRLGMLETILEFAGERLEETDAAEEMRLRHAEHYLTVAESASLSGDVQGNQRPELALAEQDNFRAALAWSLEGGEIDLGLRLAVLLENFWATNAPVEGEGWFAAFLERAEAIDDTLRARALRAAGSSVYSMGEFKRGVELYERSLAIFRELGDRSGIGLMYQRFASEALRTGELEKARDLAEAAHRLLVEAGHRSGQGVALGILAGVESRTGNGERALELYLDSAEIAREERFHWWRAAMLLEATELAHELGRLDGTDAWAREALELSRRMGDRTTGGIAIAFLAIFSARRGDFERAGTLWGAIEAEADRAPIYQWEGVQADLFAKLGATGNHIFEEAREAGRRLELDEAIELALRLD